MDLEKSRARLAEELDKSADGLSRVLASGISAYAELDAYFSCALVSVRGFQSYMEVMTLSSNPYDLLNSFVRDPVETMRMCINVRLRYELSRLGDRTHTRYLGIDETDKLEIASLNDVSTTFVIGGNTTSINWIREYGSWKVKNAIVRKPAEAPPGVQL